MKIRLHGTEDECREVAERLAAIVNVLAVSAPYRDRGASVLVRVYVEARTASPVHVVDAAEHTRRLSVDGAEIDLITAGLDVLGVAAGLTEGELAVKAALRRKLAVLDEDQAAEDTRRLAEIRALLARFDWEHDDRQLALEAIERIADGGQP
jgi:hypothetical protein